MTIIENFIIAKKDSKHFVKIKDKIFNVFSINSGSIHKIKKYDKNKVIISTKINIYLFNIKNDNLTEIKKNCGKLVRYI